jgi:acetylornithine deacetylase
MSQEVSYIDLLIEMISIPAVSRKENERSDFLEDYLKGLGYGVTRIHNNLLVGDSGSEDTRPRILLNSHMDTVSPVDGWESDPFIPLREGDKMIGLGSNDAGASVVTLIAAYQKIKAKLEKQLNLMLLISAEEEVSGANGISAVLKQLGRLDGVIVGEPTGMQSAVAERGLMVLDGELKGKAGHAARKEGENAIYKAMKDIETLAGMKFQENSNWLPKPGAQVTMISAGTSHNVVPDLCRFVVDVRSNDKYDNEIMLEMIRSTCTAELTPRSTRLKPSSLDGNHFLMKTITSCSLSPFGSSTLSDMALIPFPAVKMGPGDSARSHTAGEFILTSELDKGVELYCLFLETMADILNKNSL